ncbi:MAG TPA: hypothetical protein VFO60_04995, partial [Candidatus Dormibacteraeota bacterium]|nr:hypothetical protein [Candidatus Dormibacteraeota bacterium]
MAPVVVAVAGASGGVGATGFALALAWSHAEKGQTMLVDADGGGGTAADVLGIQDARSIANAYGATGVSAAELERQAVVVRDRPRLRVVPGFRDPGP